MGPRCGGMLKSIVIIKGSAVFRRNLDHLGLPTGTASFRAPPHPPGGPTANPPRECSYEPFLDDLPVRHPTLG